MTAIAVARPVGEVLASLVPSAVATAVRRDDDPTLRLDAEEESHIATSVPKRRAEFRTVRECARDALAQLGLPRPRQIPEERGAPPWPEGIVGSMTHCHRYRAAAVARVTLVAALGSTPSPTKRYRRSLSPISRPLVSAWNFRCCPAGTRRYTGRASCSAQKNPYTRPGIRANGRGWDLRTSRSGLAGQESSEPRSSGTRFLWPVGPGPRSRGNGPSGRRL